MIYYHIGMVPDVENIHRVKLIPARNLVFSQCIRDTSLMSWEKTFIRKLTKYPAKIPFEVGKEASEKTRN